MESWWGQLTLGAMAVVLFGFVARTFVNYVGKRVNEDRAQHNIELERLKESWEARLAEAHAVAKSWEDSAKSLQRTAAEQSDQLDRLLPGMETVVKTLEAIRQEQLRR